MQKLLAKDWLFGDFKESMSNDSMIEHMDF